MHPRSQFTFEILQGIGRNIIKIIDLNQGAMSVTNDIENVVAYIARAEEINPADHMIIYQCSSGMWDGWNAATDSFVLLHTRDFDCAVFNYLAIEQAAHKKPQSIF